MLNFLYNLQAPCATHPCVMHSRAPSMHLCAMPLRYTRYTSSPDDPPPVCNPYAPICNAPMCSPYAPTCSLPTPMCNAPMCFLHAPMCYTPPALFIHTPPDSTILNNTASVSTPRPTARVPYPVSSASIFRGAFKFPSAQKLHPPSQNPPTRLG